MFNDRLATTEDIAIAALVNLYSGNKKGETLDQLRVQKFCQKVRSSTTCVHPHTLPLTSAATQYFNFRVYHQVQTWRGYDLPPTNWGWKVSGSNLIPIMTD